MSNYSVNYTVKNLKSRPWATKEQAKQLVAAMYPGYGTTPTFKAQKHRPGDDPIAREHFENLRRFQANLAEAKRLEWRAKALASSNCGDYVDRPTRTEVAATRARNAGPQIASPFTPQLKALKAAKAARLTPTLERQKTAVGL